MQQRMWRTGSALAGLVCMLVSTQAGSQQKAEPEFESLLHHAFELHERAKYTESVPLLRQAFRIRPNDYFVNLLLGIDLLRSGEPSTAVQFLGKAAHLRPKEEFPHEYLGESYARLRRFPEAVKALEEAMQVATGSEQAIVSFVDFSLERVRNISMELRASREGLAAEYRIEALSHPTGDPNRARLLEESAGLDPMAPGIWSELALIHVKLGRSLETEQDFQKAEAANPDDLIAMEARALQAAKAQQWQDAAKYLNAAVRRSPSIMKRFLGDWPAELTPPQDEATITGTAHIFFDCLKNNRESCGSDSGNRILPVREQGPRVSPSVLFRQERWDLLANLPEPGTSDDEGWFQRGVALAEMGNCNSALPALEHIRGKGSHAVQALYLLSVCYAKSAGDAASRLQKSQDDEMVQVMRGDIFLRLRDDGKAALAEYQIALAKRPRDPAILERMAEAQLATGQNDAARESAQSALRIDPHAILAKRTLVRLFMQERDYAAALPYLRDLVSHDPTDPSTHVELGTACAQTGGFKEAVENLAPLLENGYPDQKGTLHYLLGTALRKLGRNREAESALAAAGKLSDQFQQRTLRDSK